MNLHPNISIHVQTYQTSIYAKASSEGLPPSAVAKPLLDGEAEYIAYHAPRTTIQTAFNAA